MKRVSHWLNPLAILTVATFAWASPNAAAKANTAAAPNLTKAADAVAIPVPSPEAAPVPESIKIFVPPPESNRVGFCSELLEPAIDEVLNRPAFARGKWGVLIESLEGRELFYSHNANLALIPASNVKLLTTAAALQKLDSGALIRSKSLGEWIGITNRNSNNSYADTLLRYIGGPQAARTVLAQLGMNPSSFRQVDGSGLSRQNLASPTAIVALLKAMSVSNNKGRDVFYASLPVAGVSGTLRNRLRNTTTQGKVRAKTGTLTGVRALSGYLDHPDYGIVAFSILVNQSNQSGQTLVGAIDEIVLRLSQVIPCD